MPIVKPIGFGGLEAFKKGEVMAGLEVRGKMNQSNGFGFSVLGVARLGEDRRQGGIYQKRRLGYNNKTGKPPANSGHYFVKSRSYAPANPQTVDQQARRTIFAMGMEEWKNLTPDEKTVYNKRARRRGKIGRWLWMSEYLRGH